MEITALKGLTKEQERIYQGLLQIGDLLGAFYLDAVMVLRDECTLQTKVNLVAHCAREIDSGLRAVFSPDKEKVRREATLRGKERGHYASILVALGNENSKVADEWLAIAKQFHGLAHRHEPWLKPKQVTVMATLWARYERILAILTGSPYAIRDRIHQLVTMQEPTAEILGILPNLIKGRQNQFQFFRNLDKPDWLKPLLEADAFDLGKIEAEYDKQGRRVLIDWPPLRYFANIAGGASAREEKLIAGIIRNLKKEAIEERLFVDEYTVYMVYKTLGALKDYEFDQTDADFINKYSSYSPSEQFPLHESYLVETLSENYVKAGKREGLINLLVYCFGFRKREEKINGLEEHGIYSQNKVFPNIQSAIHHHVIDGLLDRIIKLTGVELLFKLAQVIESLSEASSYELNSIASVEVSSQTEMYEYDWVWNIVQFVKNGAELLPTVDLTEFVDKLLHKKVEILYRIAIHLIRFNYKDIGGLFWKWIEKNRLIGQLNIHELYLIIREISPNLNITELKFLIAWIEDMQYESEHYKPEELERFRVYRIRAYLSAFKVQGQEQVGYLKGRNDHYLSIDNLPLKHPEFDTYSTFSQGYDIPIEQNVFEGMTVAQQVDYVMGFEAKEDFEMAHFGLRLLLNNAIIGSPEKYEEALSKLLKLNGFYIQQVISSFSWLLKNGHLKDWKTVITKINDRLLEAGTGELDNFEQALTAFSELLLKLAEHSDKFDLSLDDTEILISFCIRLLSVEFPGQLYEVLVSDHISDRLNSLWGKAFDALMIFNRVWGNHPRNTSEGKLHPLIATYLAKKINSSAVTSPTFYINLGWHFAYILPIAEKWCRDNSSLLFPADDYTFGLIIDNLFSPYQKVYKNVLDFFREAKLNAALVNHSYGDEASINRVSRYALTELGYIDNEAYAKEGTLINLILKNGDPDQYKSLIIVALQDREANEKAMLALWTDLAARISGGKPEYELIERLLGGLVLVSGVSSESLDLLDKSIPHLQNLPMTHQVLSTLYRKFESAPVRVSETVLKIWERANIRVMVNEELTNMVEKLYAEGHKSIADEISLFVAGQGNYELKTIYDKYQTEGLSAINAKSA